MNRRNVTVEVIGGLGNQLFCYAAGLNLSKRTSCQLVLDMSLVGIGGSNHGKTLLNFNLGNVKIRNRVMKVSGFTFLKRLDNKIALSLPLYDRIRNNKSKVYSAREIGFEPAFEMLKKPMYLKGYFQSYKYLESINSELLEMFKVSNPSNWFESKLRLLEEINPTIIHIRRGDYLKLQDDFGLLHMEYYLEAISRLDDAERKKPIWIFSDSPEMVTGEIQNSDLGNAEVIISPPEVTANEILYLMSRGKRIVISNSTFSWWAAYFSRRETKIFAPEFWFRDRKDPVDLIPPHWMKISNEWTTYHG